MRFDAALVDDVAALPEVEFAEGGIFGFDQVYTVGADGEVNRSTGPPVFTSSWGGPSEVSAFTLVDRRTPGGPAGGTRQGAGRGRWLLDR